MKTPIKVWRIVEKHEKGLKTLFHGINGSRILPRGVWLKAEQKIGSEGKGRKYLTAFHCLDSKENMLKFTEKFRIKKNRYIIPILAKQIRPKQGSKALLASEIFIPTNARLVKL